MAQLNNADAHSMDELLSEMRQHLSGLQDKLQTLNAATNRSQTVNEKIATMKEYQDRLNTLNSCWRSKDRVNLVASLQHENRQILALEEENKQLKLALKELEEGMHLIMSDYRRTLSGLTRSELLLELARRQRKSDFANGCAGIDEVLEISRLAERCVTAADKTIAEQDGVIAQLRCENRTLRELVFKHSRAPPTKSKTPEYVNPSSTDSSPLTAERKYSAIFIEERSPGSAVSITGPTQSDDWQALCREEDFDEKTLVEGLQEVGIESDGSDVVESPSSSFAVEATTRDNAGSRWPVHLKNRHRPMLTYPHYVGVSSKMSTNSDMGSFKGPIMLKICNAHPSPPPSEGTTAGEENGGGLREKLWPNGDICDKSEKDLVPLNNDSPQMLTPSASPSPPAEEDREPPSPQPTLQQQEQACSN